MVIPIAKSVDVSGMRVALIIVLLIRYFRKFTITIILKTSISAQAPTFQINRVKTKYATPKNDVAKLLIAVVK